MGIDNNLKKNKAMVCTPGIIWGKWGELAYKRQVTGDGETFRERKKTRVGTEPHGMGGGLVFREM